MRRLVAIAFVFLTLSWTAAPLFACMMPGPATTTQEHECCAHMGQACSSDSMPQTHSCCKMEAPLNSAVVVTGEQHCVPDMQLFAAVTAFSEPQLAEWTRQSEHRHPPGEFLPDTTVLRI
jgi:hypothetical protein